MRCAARASNGPYHLGLWSHCSRLRSSPRSGQCSASGSVGRRRPAMGARRCRRSAGGRATRCAGYIRSSIAFSRRRDCHSAAPPSPSVRCCIGVERGRQQNDSLADGYFSHCSVPQDEHMQLSCACRRGFPRIFQRKPTWRICARGGASCGLHGLQKRENSQSCSTTENPRSG